MQPFELTSGLYLIYRDIALLKYTAITLYLSCALGDKETKSDLVILYFCIRMSLDFVRKHNMKLIHPVAMFSPAVTTSILKLWHIT